MDKWWESNLFRSMESNSQYKVQFRNLKEKDFYLNRDPMKFLHAFLELTWGEIMIKLEYVIWASNLLRIGDKSNDQCIFYVSNLKEYLLKYKKL